MPRKIVRGKSRHLPREAIQEEPREIRGFFAAPASGRGSRRKGGVVEIGMEGRRGWFFEVDIRRRKKADIDLYLQSLPRARRTDTDDAKEHRWRPKACCPPRRKTFLHGPPQAPGPAGGRDVKEPFRGRRTRSP